MSRQKLFRRMRGIPDQLIERTFENHQQALQYVVNHQKALRHGIIAAGRFGIAGIILGVVAILLAVFL